MKKNCFLSESEVSESEEMQDSASDSSFRYPGQLFSAERVMLKTEVVEFLSRY